MKDAMRNTVKSILLTSFATVAGCINADPSNFPVDAGSDAGRPDVIVDDSGDAPDPNAACKTCLETPDEPGPGCKSVLDSCQADQGCAGIYDCAFEKGCMALPSLMEILICGFINCNPNMLPPNDPSFNLASGIAQCSATKCKPPCGPTP